MRKIRVTYLITRMVRGGAQRVVLHLAERLDRSVFSPAVITGTEEPVLMEELERHVQVEKLPLLARRISPRRDVRCLAALYRRFRGHPHVVHGHTYKAGVLSAVAARLAGVRAVVFTPHGHIFTSGAGIPDVPRGWKLGVLKAFTRLAQSCAHVVTALSDEDLEEQVRHGLSPRNRYRVIRNGIDVMRFTRGQREEMRRRWNLDGETIIGSVGRLTEEKGHRYLLPMLKRIPGATLAIVGDGPEKDRLLAEAEREKVRDRVRLLGEVDSAELMAAFDVYVQPSLYESQGLAILEAMAAGVPVVATRVGGVGGVVRDGKTGLLVPPADPRGLAGAVMKLRRSGELVGSLCAAAREMVSRDFSVDRMVREYEQLYLDLLRR